MRRAYRFLLIVADQQQVSRSLAGKKMKKTGTFFSSTFFNGIEMTPINTFYDLHCVLFIDRRIKI